jgi:Tfp pilus assembly protein PilV
LIEVLMALAIMAIGIMAVFSVQLRAIKNNTTGNRMTEATLLASAKLEEMKSVADIATLSSGSENNIDANGNTGGIYQRLWSVADPLGDNSTRYISVTVQWRLANYDRSVTLETITQGLGL